MIRALILLLTLTIPAEIFAAAPDELLTRIERAWLEREKLCTSGVVRWKQIEFYEQEVSGTGRREDSIVLDYEFAFKRDDFCLYSLDGMRWNTDKDIYDNESMQTALAYGQVKNLAAGQRHAESPLGWISQQQTLALAGDYQFEPPLFAFRPLAPQISSFKFAEWKIVDDSEDLNGLRCVHVENGNERLWLDPQRGFLPVRRESWIDGKSLHWRLDIDYVPHELTGWAPQSWRYVRRGDGEHQSRQKTVEGFTSTVTELHLNVPIPDSRFDITFPPRTLVNNELTGHGGVIREDGSFRPFEGSEFGDAKSLDELMHSDPPSVVERRRVDRLKQIGFWSSIAVAVAAALAAAIYYWRRRPA